MGEVVSHWLSLIRPRLSTDATDETALVKKQQTWIRRGRAGPTTPPRPGFDGLSATSARQASGRATAQSGDGTTASREPSDPRPSRRATPSGGPVRGYQFCNLGASRGGRIFRADVVITGHAAPARAPTLATSLPSLGPTRSRGRHVCLLGPTRVPGVWSTPARSLGSTPSVPTRLRRAPGGQAGRLGAVLDLLACAAQRLVAFEIYSKPKAGASTPPLARGARDLSPSRGLDADETGAGPGILLAGSGPCVWGCGAAPGANRRRGSGDGQGMGPGSAWCSRVSSKPRWGRTASRARKRQEARRT